MYQALYRKYRPKTLDEIGGQETIVKILKNTITKNQINHAYIFAGPRGTGKTSIAKIFAKMVNCQNLKNTTPCGKCASCIQENNSDIIEIDAASNNGVDEIRELKNKITLVPAYGKYKVYIIDEVHMLTTGAFNALLKTLEEPPKHIIFILATTDPHKIPETIISRCQYFNFQKISQSSIVKRLKEIATKENINIEDHALEEIARLSNGGMRDSIGLLDQAIAYTNNKITIKDIHDINGTISPKNLQELIFLIEKNDLVNILKLLDKYNEKGVNFVKFSEELIEFLRNILIYSQAEAYFKEKNTNFSLYDSAKDNISPETVIKYLEILTKATNEMKATNNPKLILELAFIKMTINTKNNVKNVEKTQSVTITQKTLQEETGENITKTSTTKETEENQSKKEVESFSKEIIKKLQKIKNIRINNTLSEFNKKELQRLKPKLNSLQDYLLDKNISKYVSILIDGELKAASSKNLIFVYPTERTENLFNQNIIEIEKTIEKILTQNYKIIAVNKNEWETIKNDFNSRKKIYQYEEEKFNIKDIFSTKKNTEFSDFDDIIEYN